MIHVRRYGGAVVKKNELGGKALWICCAGFPRQVREQRTYPRARLVTDTLYAASSASFSARADECTSAEVGLDGDLGHDIEHAEKTVPRVVVPSQSLLQPFLAGLMPAGEVSADQPLLAAEAVVERGFRDPGVFDHAVDADRVDALFVEEFLRSGQEPYARGTAFGGRGPCRHSLTIPDRSV